VSNITWAATNCLGVVLLFCQSVFFTEVALAYTVYLFVATSDYTVGISKAFDYLRQSGANKETGKIRRTAMRDSFIGFKMQQTSVIPDSIWSKTLSGSGKNPDFPKTLVSNLTPSREQDKYHII